jgi:hypothetical protein
MKFLVAAGRQTRTSGENLFVVLLMAAPPSQELEPPANPGRFSEPEDIDIEPDRSVHRIRREDRSEAFELHEFLSSALACPTEQSNDGRSILPVFLC